MKQLMGCIVATLFAVGTIGVSAQESPSQESASSSMKGASIHNSAAEFSAHQVVSEVTDEVLKIIKAAQSPSGFDLPRASGDLDKLLSQVVDFRFIVVNVMGRDVAKSASKEQLQGFVDVFKKNLVDTYSKGMAQFSDYEITVVPPEKDLTGIKKVNVRQEVADDDGTSLVYYTMAVDDDNNWVLRNMVINGVNLGKTFRNQFRVALQQNANDLDKVIATWGT